jgi:hypothetical protein
MPGTDKRQTRADIVQAIADQAPNDEMKGFAQTMAAAEGGPTGSGNPYQFMGATARQYNLKDVNDPVAATRAFFQLTDDNRRYLANALGRSPTLPELAQAHQQGAAATARMLLGTGNASAQNLAANNVDPNAPAGQASTQIQHYYYPNGAPAPTATAAAAATPPGPRATVAATMAGPAPVDAQAATTGQQPTVINGVQPAPSAAQTGNIVTSAPTPGIATSGPLPVAFPDPGPEPIATKPITANDRDNQYAKVIQYWAPTIANPGSSQGQLAQATQQTKIASDALAAQNAQTQAEFNSKHQQWLTNTQAKQTYGLGLPALGQQLQQGALAIQKAQHEQTLQPYTDEQVIATAEEAKMNAASLAAKNNQGVGTWTDGEGNLWERLANGSVVNQTQATQVKPTPEQNRDYQILRQLNRANKGLGNVNILGQWSTDMATPRPWQDPVYRQANEAADLFARQVIRIQQAKNPNANPDSVSVIRNQYFPQPNDTQQELTDKAAARQDVMDSLTSGLGTARPLWDKFVKDDAAHETMKTTVPAGSTSTDSMTGRPVISKNGYWEYSDGRQ